MNKDNAKDCLPLVQALVDGNVIQVQMEGGGWINEGSPTFQLRPCLYRIKPEPMEVWVNCYDDGSMYSHKNESSAIMAATGNSVVRRFREVIE